MKITELRCPACNGTLKIDENNSNVAVCEYCKTKYVLEWEGDNAKIGDTPVPPKPYYTPAPPKPAAQKKKTGWEPYGWKRGVALVAGFFVIVGVMYGPRVLKKHAEMEENKAIDAMAESAAALLEDASGDKAESAAKEVIPFTGVLADAAELIFNKPVETITEKELASIKWLGTKYGNGGEDVLVGYSMENPYENPEAELTWFAFDRDTAEVEMESLQNFTGLVKVQASYLSENDLKGLHLQGISCYAKSPGLVADVMEHPEELKELEITAGLDSLEGLEKFTSLERLSLDCYDLTEIRELANAKTVKDLTIENGDSVTDFSVLSVMTWLERLYVDSEGLKDISFAASMPGLKSLGLEHTKLLTLAGLESRKDTLVELHVDSSDTLKDSSAISTLTGLKKLNVEVPYNCPKPDLSPLTAMEDLTIIRFDTVSFLGSMPSLKRLVIEGGTVDSTKVFAGLNSLETLKCSSRFGDSLDFVSRLPALKNLDLTGNVTYYDISSIFNMPTLETLLLNGAECEINFGKLQDNGSLKHLEMTGMKLYKNVQVSGSGGIQYVNWDDVVLDEHIDFLTHYPNLKTLVLADNDLTKVDFASGLMELELLDISDNYVTDLKPLDTAVSLKQVDCTGNPISNPRILNEKVNVIQ